MVPWPRMIGETTEVDKCLRKDMKSVWLQFYRE